MPRGMTFFLSSQGRELEQKVRFLSRIVWGKKENRSPNDLR